MIKDLEIFTWHPSSFINNVIGQPCHMMSSDSPMDQGIVYLESWCLPRSWFKYEDFAQIWMASRTPHSNYHRYLSKILMCTVLSSSLL